MTTNEHPITPSQRLVQQWAQIQAAEQAVVEHWQHIATNAAQWGADQELQACLIWLQENGISCAHISKLRQVRRQQKPDVNEALQIINTHEKYRWALTKEEYDIIRQALTYNQATSSNA